jgi:mitochondrial import receptor subunit TOM40
MDVSQEKVEISTSTSSSSSWDILTQNPIASRIADTLSVIQSKREALGLPYPGQLEHLSKEVDRDVFLNNYSFAGLRADITKAYNAGNPMFQVSHSFAMGSQTLPPYSFGAIYGSPKVSLLDTSFFF